MMFNLARVVGPSVAVILIALVGAGICFSIDALSYGAVILSLTFMRFVRNPLLIDTARGFASSPA